jgi:hypothetical protein
MYYFIYSNCSFKFYFHLFKIYYFFTKLTIYEHSKIYFVSEIVRFHQIFNILKSQVDYNIIIQSEYFLSVGIN